MSNRNITLDILKISLAFMVVGLHAGFLSDITSLGNYLTVNGLFRIAVPIFFIINGFYFYQTVIKENTIQWFKRVLYLYVFWMLFYIYFWFRPSEVSFSEFGKIFTTLIMGYYHLWYLSGMFFAAILVFFIKKFSNKLILLSLLFTFIVGVFIQYGVIYLSCNNHVINEWFGCGRLHRNFLFFAFPFFIIGFLINKLSIHKYVSFRNSLILTIIGLILLLSESYFNYGFIDTRARGFDNFASLLLICPALFLLFINSTIQGKSKELALYATAVYFIHPLFISIYQKFTNLDATLLTLVTILSALISSYLLIKINTKLKFIL